jgi:hypothetical protein
VINFILNADEIMKKIPNLLVIFLLTAAITNASLVNWTSTDLSSDPEVGAALQAGWLVALYQDVNEDNSGASSWYNELRLDGSGGVTSSGVTSDDIFLGYTSSLEFFIAWIQLKTVTNVDVDDNIDVYTVIFDQTTMGAASSFVVADANPYDVGANDPAVDYNLGSSIAGEFQAIPEPAVASFILIFGGGLLVSRRLFSKV